MANLISVDWGTPSGGGTLTPQNVYVEAGTDKRFDGKDFTVTKDKTYIAFMTVAGTTSNAGTVTITNGDIIDSAITASSKWGTSSYLYNHAYVFKATDTNVSFNCSLPIWQGMIIQLD